MLDNEKQIDASIAVRYARQRLDSLKRSGLELLPKPTGRHPFHFQIAAAKMSPSVPVTSSAIQSPAFCPYAQEANMDSWSHARRQQSCVAGHRAYPYPHRGKAPLKWSNTCLPWMPYSLLQMPVYQQDGRDVQGSGAWNHALPESR